MFANSRSRDKPWGGELRVILHHKSDLSFVSPALKKSKATFVSSQYRRVSILRPSSQLSNNRLVESRKKYAKNNSDSENGVIGKSPDRADAVVMAFYPYATVSARIASGG